jgi:hypothetical protein
MVTPGAGGSNELAVLDPDLALPLEIAGQA